MSFFCSLLYLLSLLLVLGLGTVAFVLQSLINKRAASYRSKAELKAANARLVKELQVMEKKKLTSRNTKVMLTL